VERDVLDWLLEQMTTDEIEQVTDEMLDSLIEKNNAVLAVFCKIIPIHSHLTIDPHFSAGV